MATGNNRIFEIGPAFENDALSIQVLGLRVMRRQEASRVKRVPAELGAEEINVQAPGG